ncbi:NUDIX hydrolase [Runella aurantiaca]|uniref:NUDIX hydrolase n=1 Tax=Runella aurantiaca TaxID=2282308 RepID=A0A369I2S5_9BACT|nr:NUDIX domain-containing protein [Runella aurantiaca]RDB03858.1 NUDIX hydrolase [Runella aurantiaca]
MNELEDFLALKDRFIPQLSVDCVIFGFHNQQLKVLLLKLKNLDLWALPGGYVEQSEGIDDAAQRILEERTGLRDIYLEQFRVFGSADRSTKEFIQKIMEVHHPESMNDPWVLQRYVSIGYYALVDFSKVNPTPDFLSEYCEWFEMKQLPKLAFDHREIIQKALETLRITLDSKLVGSNLLPETFTMMELQSLYETILEMPLRRNNFQRKMLSLDILERIEKLYTGAANKAPYLYRFKKS